MSKKISFILLSTILGASTVNGMEKVQGFINPVLGAARTQMNAHPYAFTGSCFATGLVATDALRKFPVGSALVNGTRAALSSVGTQLANACSKTKDGVFAAYGVVRHPVESAKVTKDVVIAHPYATASIVAGSAVAEEEIRRGFPMSARVKKAAVTYAPKAGKYVKEKSSLALGYTKENAPRVWEFTKTIPSILWAHKRSTIGAGVIAGTAAVVSVIRYRSAITERSKTVWGKTVSAWNWLKSKVIKSNETSSQEDSQQSE